MAGAASSVVLPVHVAPVASEGEAAFQAALEEAGDIPYCGDGDSFASTAPTAGGGGSRKASSRSVGGRHASLLGRANSIAAQTASCDGGDDSSDDTSVSASARPKKTVPARGFALAEATDDWTPDQEIRERQTAESPDVNLGEYKLVAVPELLFASCRHLVALDLSGNLLETLPEAIGTLSRLQYLTLKSNKLQSLPDNIGDCKALTHLLVDQNELEAVPESCSGLTQLEVVGLDWNDLKSFPDPFCKVHGLHTLYLRENPELRAIPGEGELGGFAELALHLDNSPELVAAYGAIQGKVKVTVTWNKVFPDKILDHIFLGSLRSAQEPRVYRALGIGYLASIGRELSVVLGEGMQQLQLNVDDLSDTDLSPLFDKVHEFIDEARAAGTACLVHCFKGQSRSATMVVTYLMKTQRMLRDDAVAFVRKNRPMVNPNAGFMKQMSRYEVTLGLRPQTADEEEQRTHTCT